MEPKLFIGNLSYQVGDEDLKQLFAQCGTVQSAEVVKDKYSGQSKGFAFVVMGSPQEAEKALSLNGTDLLGRAINVSEARPPKPRDRDSRRGGSGGGNSGGGGGYGNKPFRKKSW